MRWTFGLAAVLLGALLGALAIVINWYVGNLLS
jgi:hypothetical protein